jgi:hypothetical protein
MRSAATLLDEGARAPVLHRDALRPKPCLLAKNRDLQRIVTDVPGTDPAVLPD